MAEKAKWGATVRQRSTDAEGTMHLVVELTDAGVVAATIRAEITADRVLRLEYDPADTAHRLTGFYAWEV